VRTRLVLGLLFALLLAAPAHAATTQVQALQIAGPHQGHADAYFRRHPDGSPFWLVSSPGREVDVDARSGRIEAVWTGWHATFRSSRGHYGGMSDSWWVWLPLCLLFLAPFFDFRRPFRMLHFDLLALLAFGVSHLFYNQGNYLVSVPLVYPVLGYLLARMLWLGFMPRHARGPLVPYARTRWLVAGLVLLVGFRVFVNVDTAKVLDIGSAGVQGAGAVLHGHPIYVGDRLHRDTYGPLNYLAYVPFVKLSPSSLWSQNPAAAHMASIFFDLLVLLGLFSVGRRLRAGAEGTKLGVALAFAWAAFPYSMYALALNTNDSLVAALLLLAFLAFSSPKRGIWLGAAIAAKFAPLALVPLFARGRTRAYGAALLATLAVLFLPFMPSPHRLWELTIGFQLHRQTPFSLWILYPSLAWLKALIAVGAVALAVAVAFVRPKPAPLAALAAAVLIAVQLTSAYWFYFYVVWFAPFVLIALFSLDIPRSTQIPSGMRVWSTRSSSPISSGSRRSRRQRVTTALPR
jgi:hypothetical protein